MTVSTHTATISGSTITHNGGTVLNGGTIASATPFVGKSPREITQGVKRAGSVVLASTGTATHPGITTAESTGKLAYNPSSPEITRSSTDTGFVIRGGVPTKIASVATATIDFHARGSDGTHRAAGNIHVPNGITKYQQLGTWATQIFDAFGGGLLQSDGTAKAGITGWATDGSNDVSLAVDHAATPTKAIPGELTILFNHVTFTTNNVDYSAITG